MFIWDLGMMIEQLKKGYGRQGRKGVSGVFGFIKRKEAAAACSMRGPPLSAVLKLYFEVSGRRDPTADTTVLSRCAFSPEA